MTQMTIFQRVWKVFAHTVMDDPLSTRRWLIYVSLLILSVILYNCSWKSSQGANRQANAPSHHRQKRADKVRHSISSSHGSHTVQQETPAQGNGHGLPSPAHLCAQRESDRNGRAYVPLATAGAVAGAAPGTLAPQRAADRAGGTRVLQATLPSQGLANPIQTAPKGSAERAAATGSAVQRFVYNKTTAAATAMMARDAPVMHAGAGSDMLPNRLLTADELAAMMVPVQRAPGDEDRAGTSYARNVLWHLPHRTNLPSEMTGARFQITSNLPGHFGPDCDLNQNATGFVVHRTNVEPQLPTRATPTHDGMAASGDDEQLVPGRSTAGVPNALGPPISYNLRSKTTSEPARSANDQELSSFAPTELEPEQEDDASAAMRDEQGGGLAADVGADMPAAGADENVQHVAQRVLGNVSLGEAATMTISIALARAIISQAAVEVIKKIARTFKMCGSGAKPSELTGFKYCMKLGAIIVAYVWLMAAATEAGILNELQKDMHKLNIYQYVRITADIILHQLLLSQDDLVTARQSWTKDAKERGMSVNAWLRQLFGQDSTKYPPHLDENGCMQDKSFYDRLR